MLYRGGLTDPGLIVESDLTHAKRDNLLMRVRKILRQKMNYPAGEEAPFPIYESLLSNNCSGDSNKAKILLKAEIKNRKKPWNIDGKLGRTRLF